MASITVPATASSTGWAAAFHGKDMVCIAEGFVPSLAVCVCMCGLCPEHTSQLETPSCIFPFAQLGRAHAQEPSEGDWRD